MPNQAPADTQVVSIGFRNEDHIHRFYIVVLNVQGEEVRAIFKGPSFNMRQTGVQIIGDGYLINVDEPESYGLIFDKQWIERFYTGPSMLKVTTPPCPHCKMRSELTVPAIAYGEWAAGKLIQKAFPEMTPEDRDLLKYGWHENCWNTVMGEDD